MKGSPKKKTTKPARKPRGGRGKAAAAPDDGARDPEPEPKADPQPGTPKVKDPDCGNGALWDPELEQ